MREEALAGRASLHPDQDAAERLARAVLDGAVLPPDSAVAGYWPIGSEIDVRPLLQGLAARGHRLALPVTLRRGLPLGFRVWPFGDPLVNGPFGTSHPAEHSPQIVPDVLLIPLLAFDRAGRRLGYGAGYYDRTLAALPGAQAIGCAFAGQEVPEVPAGPYDMPLPLIATDAGLMVTGGGR